MIEQSYAEEFEALVGKIAAYLLPDPPSAAFSSSEWRVLSELAKAPSVSLGVLCVKANATASRTFKIARRLSALGLAELRKATTSRRHYEVVITSQGRKVHETLFLQAESSARRAVGKVINQDLLLAIQLLSRCPSLAQRTNN